MRKLHFLFFMLFAFSALSMAQVVENFEGTTMNLFSGGSTGTVGCVANPDPTGINTSPYVGKMLRAKDGDAWQGWYGPVKGDSVDAVATRYAHIKVWKSRKSRTCFKLENGTIANTGDIFSTFPDTLVNQWFEVVFDFGKHPGKFGQIVLIPDFPAGAVDLTEDIVLYFDDIYMNNDSTVGSAPVQMLANFEPIPLNIMAGGAEDLSKMTVVANPHPDVVNMSSSVVEFIRDKDGVPWGGFWSKITDSVNVTDNKFVHVKVWKSRISPVKFKLEGGASGTLEIPSIYPQTKTNGWEDMVFDFRSKTGTYPIIALMPDVVDPVGLDADEVIYFDDIVINNDSVPIVAYDVTFNMDMTNSGLTPGQHVWISGTLGGTHGSWAMPGTNPNNQVFDPDGDGIYSITIPLLPSSLMFKFFKGDNWDNGDNGPGDRPYTVAGSAVVNCQWGVKGEVTPKVHAPTTYTVKAKNAVVIDGLLTDADWATAQKYELARVFKGETIDGPADCSAFFQTVWADSGVFVAVTVTDDILGVTSGGKYGPDWNQDLVEVYFDMNTFGLRDGKGPSAGGSGHYQSADRAKDTTITGGTGIKYTYKHTGTNGDYVKELYFPWKALKDIYGNQYKPNANVPLGFDVYIADNDTSQADKAVNFRNRLVWSNIGTITEDYANMDDAGKMVLLDAPAVYVPQETKSVKAKKAVVIDGALTEADWTTAKKYDIARVFKGENIDGPNDCSGFFQTLWADSGVFVAVTVTDDILGVTSGGKYGPDWNQDLVEVYFDMNTLSLKDGVGPSAGGSGHYQSADRAKDTTITSATGIKYTYKHSSDTTGNYVKELYFPWKALKDIDGKEYTPNANVPLGFDVYIADNDTSQADKAVNFRNRLVWSNFGAVAEDYANMNDAGKILFTDAPADLVPKEVTAVKAKKAIAIDAVLTDADWATARKYDIAQVYKGESINGPTDCSAFFQTVWADSGIFVAVTVTDDIKGVTAGGKYGPDWNQDLVEVYFDMNLGNLKDGKGPSVAGKGHYQSARQAQDTIIKDATFLYAYKHSTKGNYVKELYVPWKVLKDSANNLFTDNTLPIGFDVYVADNDTSQADKAVNFRNRLVWSNIGTINEDYANMNDAGHLYISGIPLIWPDLVKSVNVSNLMFYPNPANDYIIIRTSRNDLLPVSVINLTGQTVISTTISDKGQLDISNLDKGMYFIKVSDKNQIFTGKLVKK